VVGAEWTQGRVVHRVDGESLPDGSEVVGRLDWERRLAHMRAHTALHILSGVVFRRFGSGITGGQISGGRARMDFALPEFNRSVASALVDEANEVVLRNLAVRVRYVDRETLDREPQLVRVARELLPTEEPRVRLIDIEGHDVQADGGTHVRTTGEVGRVSLDALENKGARNKRLYLRIGDSESPVP
jgi:misacylated tRNA(Ala) deacylase